MRRISSSGAKKSRVRDGIPNLVFLHESIVQLANVLDCTKINEEPFYSRRKLIELTPVKEKIVLQQ